MSLSAARRYRATAFLLFFMLCGCGARSPVPVSMRAGQADIPSADELLSEMRAREKALATFRGQATLVYEGPDGKSKSSQMIVVKAPDRVRIDFMSPFGPTYTVATDGRHLRAYDRGEKVLYVGMPTPTNIQRYARVPLTVALLAALIRGIPPFLQDVEMPRVRAEDGEVSWESALSGGGAMRVHMLPVDYYPRGAHIMGTEVGNDLRVSFDAYENVDGVPVAHRIRAYLPGGERVELRYSRVWRDLRLTDTAFQVDIPSGVRRVAMDGAVRGGGAD